MKKNLIIAAASVLGAVLLCVILNFATHGAVSSTALSVLASAKIITLAESVYISEKEIQLTPTSSAYQLVAAVYPGNSVEKKIEWKSDNIGVAQVDENGYVTPVGAGIAHITASCGDKKAGCDVIVYQPVESILLDQSMLRVRRGTEAQLTAKIRPDNASDRVVHWSSSDEAVAIVDHEGYVFVIGAGSADIIAEAADGKKAYCRILSVEAEPTPTPVPDPTARPGRTATPASPTPSVTQDTDYEYDDEDKKIEPVSPEDIVMEYPYTLEDMVRVQMGQNPKIYRSSVYSSATVDEVRTYIDPVSAYNNPYMKYQFVDLSQTAGVDEQSLDMFLAGKGILSGRGDAFVGAAKQYNVSELYLVAHACLETGNGTSKLASGVNYNGTTVYNMFGIGAYDESATSSGAKYAYEHGWTTPEKAIYGGAEFVSKNYINGEYRQNTLYKMLWNPNAPGTHQYATDIGWAVKQAQTMKRFYEMFGISSRFEVPSYE